MNGLTLFGVRIQIQFILRCYVCDLRSKQWSHHLNSRKIKALIHLAEKTMSYSYSPSHKTQTSSSFYRIQTQYQNNILEKAFASNKYPNGNQLLIVAHETGLNVFQVKEWFDNRLVQWRQEQGFPASIRRVYEI